MPQKKQAAEKKDSWKNYSFEEYRQQIEKSAHFSLKTVNSNIETGGVRLCTKDGLALPYVATRTLMHHLQELPAPESLAGGPMIGRAIQLNRILNHEESAAETNADRIRAAYKAGCTHAEPGCEVVSPRLRQLLLPKNGGYVAVSPLGSGWLSVRVNECNRDLLSKNCRPHLQAELPIGGANPQNVGVFARAMSSPLVFKSPTEDTAIKEAFSIYFKGVSLAVPRTLAEQYRDWRIVASKKKGSEAPATDLRARKAHKRHLAQMCAAVLKRGDSASEKLSSWRDLFSEQGSSLLSPELGRLMRGVIFRDERTLKWKKEFAEHFADKLMRHRFQDNSKLGISAAEADLITKWIEELL